MADIVNIVPITTSLQDYQVPIDKQVRKILTEQLFPLHQQDEEAATEHFSRILVALKLPPTVSVCRVNFCHAAVSRKQVMENLRTEFQQNWDPAVTVIVQPHKVFSDVIEILVASCGEEATSFLCHKIPPHGQDTPILFHKWPRRQAFGWPMTHRVVICDRFCAEAVLRGSHIFKKGILCADAGVIQDEIVAVYGYVGSDKTKPTQGSTLEHDIRGTCLFLGLGKTHCDRLQFFSNSNDGIGVSMTLCRAAPILPPLHNAVVGTGGMIQNLPSIVVGHALDPQTGDVILDMCCAPGGKTTHIASLVRNEAIIVACDKSRSKVLRVQDFVGTMGANDCITLLALDATRCVVDSDKNETVQEILANASRKEDGLLDIAGFPPASFDRILLDPPCSALGLRPKLAIRLKAKELVKTAEYQRIFLQQAVKLLKPGGILTYSTCTINALENEGNVAYVLQEYGDCMSLLPLPADGLGHPGLEGHGLTEKQRLCVKRFDPSDEQDNCMGFFVAKFQKNLI